MMESTKSPEQGLGSLLQQGFYGSNGPPADVTASSKRFFRGERSIPNWTESPLTHTNQEMIPDE